MARDTFRMVGCGLWGPMGNGQVIGLMSPTIWGPRHIVQWAANFNRKLAKCDLGGEVCELSEMLEHMSMPREFFTHFRGLSPCMAGPEDFESLRTHLKNKTIFAEKFLARRCMAIQPAIETRGLGNVYWPPGLGNPADGLAETLSALAPPLRILGSGMYNPGA